MKEKLKIPKQRVTNIPPQACTELIVGQFNWWEKDENINQFLKQYGDIADIDFLEDGPTGKFLGFCFVKMRQIQDAVSLQQSLNNKMWKSMTLVVQYASKSNLKKLKKQTTVNPGISTGGPSRHAIPPHHQHPQPHHHQKPPRSHPSQKTQFSAPPRGHHNSRHAAPPRSPHRDYTKGNGRHESGHHKRSNKRR